MCDSGSELHSTDKTSTGLLEMAPGRRQKKGSWTAKIAVGIGYVLVGTLGLPVVLSGGSVQLLSTGLSRLFCPNDGYTNGKKSSFQPTRKGVKIFPA